MKRTISDSRVIDAQNDVKASNTPPSYGLPGGPGIGTHPDENVVSGGD